MNEAEQAKQQDKNDRSPNGLDAHEEYTRAYIGILNTYQEQISKSITSKNELKCNFFCMIRFIMIALVLLFFIAIIVSMYIFSQMIAKNYQSVSVISGAVTAMISTLSTMVLSIFKLPQIIADYLFNKEEDNQMNEVIKNIQKYEIDAFKLERITRSDANEASMADLEMKESNVSALPESITSKSEELISNDLLSSTN